MPSIADITVVLPTRNEARNIEPFLRSLPECIPLVVVDRSDDETREIIGRMRPERTKVLYCAGTLTEARQAGAQHATTRWLLFTDADVEFSADYFGRLAAVPSCDVAYGAKLSQREYRRYYAWFMRGQQLVHSLGLPCASGSNLLVSAGAFEAVGGFDLGLTCNEDSELVWRMQSRGYRCRFDPQLVVWATDHRRLRRGLWLKTLHSLMRCVLLRTGWMPAGWRRHDWGYWTERPSK